MRSSSQDVIARISKVDVVQNVQSPLDEGNAAQISENGRAALVEFEIRGPADEAADKTVTTHVRRLADPVAGDWIESTAWTGRVLDAAPVADRLAVLNDDGTWRLAYDGGNLPGPPPPDGRKLYRLAAAGDVLWAIGHGKGHALVLLKWTEQSGWAVVADTPPAGLAPNGKPDIASVPNNHLAYAGQWFFFAAIAAIIYVLALGRRGKVVSKAASR